MVCSMYDVVCSTLSVHRLLVTAYVDSSSPVIVTLMKKAILSSETLFLTRATGHNFPEDGILYSCSAFLGSGFCRFIPEEWISYTP
jgi:hypothetical protein